MMDFIKYREKPTPKTLCEYPTILEILDTLAEKEQMFLRSFQPLSHITLLKNAHVLGHSTLVKGNGHFPFLLLMPSSPSPTTYYRGECKYHESVKPSLMRSKEIEKDSLIATLQTCEMILLLNTHPIIRFIQENGVQFGDYACIKLPVVYEALAQHYGIKTNLLDITNDKWTAAFFACCKYRNGHYSAFIVDNNTPENERYGVIYMLDYGDKLFCEQITERIAPVGMQYFNRPGRQSGLVIDMSGVCDLNNMPDVQRIFFRHDNKCSQLIYSLSQKSKLFMPEDGFGNLVDKIIQSTSFCRETLSLASSKLCMSREEIIEKLYSWGYRITEYPYVFFDKEQVEKEWYEWNHGGKERYASMVDVVPAYKM